MPISEDEYDFRSIQEPQVTMSKAELRKTHKPIMEKRRRARINHCLNEIKTLILEAMNKDPARHSKLEKADILEMAVKHLQNVQRQQLAIAMATDPSVLRKFKTGFNECATEIDRYINQIEGVDSGIKERMTNHLQKCITGIEQVAHLNFPSFTTLPLVTQFSRPQPEASTSLVGDQNNNAPRIQIPQGIQGIQLIPSRLPSGELALLVPNSSALFPTIPTGTTRERPSAFAAVIPSATATKADETRSPEPEPEGFRPVQPQQQKQQQQVPQVSSTSLSLSAEVKPIKFPINYPERDRRKIVEPLCVITNQSERFKHALPVEESRNFEENRQLIQQQQQQQQQSQIQQGVKRKYEEMAQSQGLLTVSATHESGFPAKVARLSDVDPEPGPSGSRDNETSDMWRPW